MGTMVDYLDWRGDLSLKKDPFNEIDSSILAELAYLDLEGIVPRPGASEGVPIREVLMAWSKKTALLPDHLREAAQKKLPLLDKMADSVRFGDVRLRDYINLVDTVQELQMAAVSFLLGDGSVFAAFRGTDSSIIGWKEDLNFSYTETSGQKYAAEYLNVCMQKEKLPVRVGGHSKGGNFAVYASAFCERAVSDRIMAVYSHDGPGFNDKISSTEEFRRIAPRIRKYIPEDSIVGILLEDEIEYTVIKSYASGVKQHDMLTWEVIGTRFVKADARTSGSTMFDQTVRGWLSELNEEERRSFIESIFSVVSSTGATTLHELGKNRIETIGSIAKSVSGLPKEEQRLILNTLLELAKSGNRVMTAELLRRILGHNIPLQLFTGGQQILNDIKAGGAKLLAGIFGRQDTEEEGPEVPRIPEEPAGKTEKRTHQQYQSYSAVPDPVKDLMAKYDRMDGRKK